MPDESPELTDHATATATKSSASLRRAQLFARIAVGLVFIVNVQCALSFIINPAAFAPAYELSGIEGDVAIRGLGVAFLMWNATYPAVIVYPLRNRSLYIVVLAQQLIGLLGETWIYTTLPVGHTLLESSIMQFIIFDAFGLIIMSLAFVLLHVLIRRGKRTPGVS